VTFIFNDGTGSTVNITTGSFSALMFRLKELLKTAGWVHEASSDGTNVSNTTGNANDQITGTEFTTNNAWWVGADPNGRTWIFRRGASDGSWMVVYVPLDAAGAKQVKTANGTTAAVPTYTTQQVMVGTLPNTTAAWATGAGNRWALAADNQAPYGTYMVGWSAAGAPNTAGGIWIVDPLARGTYKSNDADPYVFHVRTSSGSGLLQAGIATDTTGPLAYYRKGLTGEAWLTHQGMVLAMLQGGSTLAVAAPADFGLNPYNPREEDCIPIVYGRRAGVTGTVQQAAGFKGHSSLMRWRSCNYPTGFLLKRKVANDRIVIGDVTLPWDTTVTAISY
jgi:hypothetical protein